MSVRYAHCMSIRRTQQTVERLWNFTMDGQDGRPMPSPHAHCHHAHAHARQSPSTCDPEAGYKEHPRQPELYALQMQPPKLQGAGICSRFMTMALCCFCVCTTFVVWSVLLSMPAVVEARGVLAKHMSATAPPPPKQRPIPAVLRRFALLKRAKAPLKGADVESVKAAFPHWNWQDGLENPKEVVSDLALAISALVDRLDPPTVETRQVEPLRPILQIALPSEPEATNSQPGEDTEL